MYWNSLQCEKHFWFAVALIHLYFYFRNVFVFLKHFCMFHSLLMYTSVLGIKISVQACHANGCQTCTPLDETHFLCASSYLLHCSKLLSVFVLLSSCWLWCCVAASKVKGMCAISEIRCICNKNYDLSSVIVLDCLLSLFEIKFIWFAMKKSWKTSYVGMRLLL